MMLYKLLAGIDRTRYDSTVISLMSSDTRIAHYIEDLDVEVFTLNMRQHSVSMFAVIRLIKLIRRLQPDIIQGWMYHGNFAASIGRLLAFERVPVLWNVRQSMHGLSYEKKSSALIIRICAILSSTVEKIVYNTIRGAQQHENIGYSSKRKTVIPNGFDCNRFSPSKAAREKLHKDLNIKEDDLIIGAVGRFHPQKDHANFMRAAGILVGLYDNVHFVLVGRDVDSKNAVLEKLSSDNGLVGKVHLLGERKDMPEITAGLDIATSASLFGEGFPNAIGEAMACGVPCVVTDVGDSAMIVGDTGVSVAPGDASALVSGWKTLLDSGLDERARLGREARKRVHENYRLELVVNQYESLYSVVVGHAFKGANVSN